MTSKEETIPNIGSRLELFVDDYLIDRMQGTNLMLHHPIMRETVFSFDAPWEGDWSLYVIISKDTDKYRMYYRGTDRVTYPAAQYVCTAESADGMNWVRPDLGLYEFNGSTHNNIVHLGPGSHGFTPIKDTNPDAKPDELYKTVTPVGEGNWPPLYVFFSPDGYHWRQVSDGPVITKGAFDCQNPAFWDANRGEYVCFFRAAQGGAHDTDYANGYRSIKRCTSKDFFNWTEPEWLVYDDGRIEQFYTNVLTPYFRAPHIYLGFPSRFMPDRKRVQHNMFPGVSDTVFMTSRDGLHFKRWQEAFVRPDLGEEGWIHRNNMVSRGILELQPGELSLYVDRGFDLPSNRLVRATMRTDGFVSVHAGGDIGEMTTRPFAFDGSELVMNYSTSAAGGVQVEVQDEIGKPIPGFSMDDCPVIYGDEIEETVGWKSGTSLAALAGRPVRLRFRLQDADLYSVRFLEVR